jgi:hypothetical protein
MKEIYMDEASQEFAKCWQAAGIHLQNQAGGKIDTWIKANLEPPFLEHLSFRLGNQLFFIRVEDADEEVVAPGNSEALFTIAEGCNGHACVMPMKKHGDEWRPLLPGWGLLDPNTQQMINPAELISDEKIVMTDWELHDFAVQVVRQQLEGEGKKILTWQSNPGVDPSIWFEGERGPEWVVVREVRYPESDAAIPENIDEIIRHCAQMSAHAHFASVAFINLDDPIDPMAAQNCNFLPLYRGYGANIRYEGLKAIATAE